MRAAENTTGPMTRLVPPTVIGGLPPADRVDTGPSPTVATSRVRVALLDDHEVLLDSVTVWFRQHAPEFEMALSVSSWLQLVHSPAFPTDLVILDVQLREPVSIEARVRTCRAAGAKVIVLTGLDTPELRQRAARSGAAAFVGKSQPLTEVARVARSVMGVQQMSQPAADLARAESAGFERPRLSVSEEEAFRLYVEGRSTSEVADAMNVRFETAKTYLRRVREKYARAKRPASRKADLIRRAAEDGYLR